MGRLVGLLAVAGVLTLVGAGCVQTETVVEADVPEAGPAVEQPVGQEAPVDTVAGGEVINVTESDHGCKRAESQCNTCTWGEPGSELAACTLAYCEDEEFICVEYFGAAAEIDYQYNGELDDVTDGKTIRGVNTGGNSFGIAQAAYLDSQYHLLATFENLPDPQGTDFYEGWVVRTGSRFNVISSGKLDKVGGAYQNVFTSAEDLTDHAFYVLTLEPDDGDPAPADHIVEGTMIRL